MLQSELRNSTTEEVVAELRKRPAFVFASHDYGETHLLMPLYLCRRWEGFVTAREHEALAWVKPGKMGDYPMPPADAPLVAWLRDLL